MLLIFATALFLSRDPIQDTTRRREPSSLFSPLGLWHVLMLLKKWPQQSWEIFVIFIVECPSVWVLWCFFMVFQGLSLGEEGHRGEGSSQGNVLPSWLVADGVRHGPLGKKALSDHRLVIASSCCLSSIEVEYCFNKS